MNDMNRECNSKILNFNINISKKTSGFSRKHGYDVVCSVVVQNILCCINKNTLLVYSRNTHNRIPPKRYNKRGLGVKAVIKAISELEKDGWLINTIGKSHIREESRVMSSIKPTEKFLTYFKLEDAEMDAMTEQYIANLENIILRNEEGELADYVDNDYTNHSREVLKKLNTLISKTDIIIGATGEVVDNTGMCRIYNRDFEHGGRIYHHGALSIANSELVDGVKVKKDPSLTRLGLLIDGEEVVEVDYRCLHIFMLYDILGIDTRHFNGDIYSSMLDNDRLHNPNNRKLMKKSLNIMLNSTRKKQAMCAIQAEIRNNKGLYDYQYAKDVMLSIMEALCDVSHVFFPEDRDADEFANIGLMLQKRESDILVNVINSFVEEDKPILPIHDSAIVKITDLSMLLGCMGSEYRNNIKSEFPIDVHMSINYSDGTKCDIVDRE